MEIRVATTADAEYISKIYEPYVKNTAVSFEYEAPDKNEIERRLIKTLEEYPYLVAEIDGKIVGYAYAGSFKARAAYKHSVELSVYVEQEHRKMGIGNALYQRLMEILLKQNVYKVHACIAFADEEDEYLTNDSKIFHEKMGFDLSAKHSRCGYKFGKWYSVIWMDKDISEIPNEVADFIPFVKLV